MFTLTLSAAGELTLPEQVREALNLLPGVKVQGELDGQGRLILSPARHDPEELFEGRPPVSRVLSVEDMDEAISRAAGDGGSCPYEPTQP